MQLAIIHYHLNRGGVSRVIESHLRGLGTLPATDQPTRATIFYGGRHDGWNENLPTHLPFPLTMVSIAELDYDTISNASASRAGGSSRLSLRLQAALDENDCDLRETVLHIHNHSLGKNRYLPAAIGELAKHGWHLLLQPHDFAEELRPENYRHLLTATHSREELQSQLYPQAAHLHYATLNGRDFNVLRNAGFDDKRTHWLPNPVGPTVRVRRDDARTKLQKLGVPQDRTYVLYPVRAIRRKNLGELLLWSAVFPQVTFAVTLAPLNPQEAAAYHTWTQLAASLELNVLFDVGGRGGMTLEENYAAADAVLTTSLAEGFGLVFLEASMANLPLFGRDLPSITADFRESGLDFSGLTDTVQIPCNRIDRDRLARKHAQLFGELCQAYGQPAGSTDELTEKIQPSFDGDSCDFGRFDLRSQQDVVNQAVRDASLRAELLEINPCFQTMSEWLNTGDHEQDLAANREVIEQNYSLAVIGKRYRQICEEVLKSPVNELTFDARYGQLILEQFVRLDRLFPIRLES
jgi:glycosyltransferase involved in cell wall biosynthesis